MEDLFVNVASNIIMWFLGFLSGYIIFAPENNYKQAFLNGLTLKIIWGKFVKK